MNDNTLTPTQAFNALHSFIVRLSMMVMWLSFALHILVMLVAALFALWFWQVRPEQCVELLFRVLDSKRFQLSSFLGVGSLGSVLLVYIALWRRIYGKISAKYLCKDLDKIS